MDREEATQEILEAKKEKGLTFEALARKAGLDEEVGAALQEIPMRGRSAMCPACSSSFPKAPITTSSH